MSTVPKQHPKENRLRPIHPNIGIEAEYRRKLTALIDEMDRSLRYWLEAAYKANEPLIAQDELPAVALRKALRQLSARWRKRFDEMAPKLAEWFAQSAAQRSDATLKRILRDGGISVRFQMGRAARDILEATVNQNVALIKSIPQQYFTQVEGAVMRSVTQGRDLASLSKELQEHFGVTKRRAAFIARDQNNKATASITRARQIEMGLTEAIWVHSGGGKHPRPTHVKAGRDRVRYDVRKGWYDPAVKRRIFPGEEPNCRCVSRSVIKGFA